MTLIFSIALGIILAPILVMLAPLIFRLAILLGTIWLVVMAFVFLLH